MHSAQASAHEPELVCTAAGALLVFLATILTTLSATPLPGRLELQDRHRHKATSSPILSHLPLPASQREYELVVLRFNEDISTWIKQVPDCWYITVLNKGKADVLPSRQSSMDIINSPQTNENGREGELMAAFIYQRWNTLAEYTAFCQGNPLEHNPEYISLLKQRSLLSAVQPMSYIYKPGITNAGAIEMHKKHPLFRSEVISLRTLDSVYFRDDYIWMVAQWVAENFSVPLGTNLVSHYLSTVGLPDWVPAEQETGAFAYGAMIGVHQSKIRQHSQEVYIRISSSVTDYRWTGVVLERAWLMIFGGSTYRDA